MAKKTQKASVDRKSSEPEREGNRYTRAARVLAKDGATMRRPSPTGRSCRKRQPPGVLKHGARVSRR
jgi:hypothetical protein